MDKALNKAAEREMRRSVPEEEGRPAKRRRADAKEGFQELSRFDYAAADSLADGSQGFLVTCAFRREKSATREAITVLGGVVIAMSPDAQPPTWSIVKMPSKGVALLRWNRDAQLPSPTDVVSQLIRDIVAGKHTRLNFVQRITPVEVTCALEEQALRKAMAQLAKDKAAGLGGAEGRSEDDRDETPVLRFAVAWRSRRAEQAASTAAQPNGEREHDDTANKAAGPRQSGMSRDEVIGAVADAFVEGTAHMWRSVVDLKIPDCVLIVEGVPVGRQMWCALSIVSADLTSNKSKLAILSVSS